MIGDKVLVTRAAPEATAAALKAAGFAVFVEPLLKIRLLDLPRPSLAAAPSLMITSQASLHALEKRRTEVADLLDRPCFCVGAQTARAAEAFGFCRVIASSGDGLALAEKIKNSAPVFVPLLHLAAALTDSRAAGALRRAGFEVVTWPLYEAVAVRSFSLALRQALQNREIGAALFFSARTGQTFRTCATAADLAEVCRAMAGVAVSARVARALEPLPWRRLAWARTPSLESVIACLEEERQNGRT